MTFLKLTRATLLLFCVAVMPANAQKDSNEVPRPQPSDALKSGQSVQQSKPSPQGQPAKAPKRAPQTKAPTPQSAQRAQSGQHQPAHTQQQIQAWQQTRGWASHGGWQPQTNFQQGRDQNWAADHRDREQRGGYAGSYIPEVSFGLYFGDSHFFHIGIMPVMFMGYPRFRHGGFAFLMVDPWPGSWQENWYTSDDVYIDYDNGYYLHDRRYPGVRIAVAVAI